MIEEGVDKKKDTIGSLQTRQNKFFFSTILYMTNTINQILQK